MEDCAKQKKRAQRPEELKKNYPEVWLQKMKYNWRFFDFFLFQFVLWCCLGHTQALRAGALEGQTLRQSQGSGPLRSHAGQCELATRVSPEAFDWPSLRARGLGAPDPPPPGKATLAYRWNPFWYFNLGTGPWPFLGSKCVWGGGFFCFEHWFKSPRWPSIRAWPDGLGAFGGVYTPQNSLVI